MDLNTIATVSKAIPKEAITEEVKSALSDIESLVEEAKAISGKVGDLQKELEEAQREQKRASIDLMSYKAKLESAERKIDERNEQVKEFETKFANYDELVSENENLKTLKVERDNAIRDEYQKRIDEYSKKEAFEKVKGKIVLPSEEKKLTDLTIEEITASNAKLDEAVEYGLFGSTPTKTPKDAGNEETVEGDTMEFLDAMNIPRPT